MTEQSLRNLVASRAKQSSYRALADELSARLAELGDGSGLTYGYLHQVVSGRSGVSRRLARALGYERVVEYRKVQEHANQT